MNNIVETIFSTGLALSQNSMLKSSVYTKENIIYIMNLDHTVLLRFRLLGVSLPETSFYLEDYESQNLEIKEDSIVFVTSNNEYTRRKHCRQMRESFDDINSLFISYGMENSLENKIEFSSKILPLLDSDLSHIEISCKNSNLKLIQRDIFSGNYIEVIKNPSQGLLGSSDLILNDFGPIGVRTNDFIAVFSYQNKISVHLSSNSLIHFCKIEGERFYLEGILALCQYDEMLELTSHKDLKGEDHGRKEQKEREDKQEISGQNNERIQEEEPTNKIQGRHRRR